VKAGGHFRTRPRQAPLADLTPESMWALAAAKLVGARAPDWAGMPLMQRLLFSSTAAVWSQAGGGRYAAANAALGAAAAGAAAAGAPAALVALGPFAGAGMAAAHAGGLAALGVHALAPGGVTAAFWAAGYAPRPVRARLDVARFARINQARGRWALLDRLAWRPSAGGGDPPADDLLGLSASAGAPAPAARIKAVRAWAGAHPDAQPHAEAPAVAALRLDDVERIVRTASGEVLGQDLGAGGRFAAGGLDSLTAVELASGIGKAIGRELPSTLAFDYPSVPEAAAHVLALLAPAPAAARRLGASSDGGPGGAVTQPGAALPDPAPGARPLLRLTSAARLPADPPQRGAPAEAVGAVPLERWDLEAGRGGAGAEAGPAPQPRARFGGWLAGVDAFDAAAFAVPAAEAELMDPQQRLLLEVSWEALQARGADCDLALCPGQAPAAPHGNPALAQGEAVNICDT